MMFAIALGSQPNVAAGLMADLISKTRKSFD